MNALLNECPVHRLLDSGCDLSIVNSSLVSGTQIEPSRQRLFAADGYEVPIEGQVKLHLVVDGMQTELTALVSKAVDDVTLGIDWLQANECNGISATTQSRGMANALH